MLSLDNVLVLVLLFCFRKCFNILHRDEQRSQSTSRETLTELQF